MGMVGVAGEMAERHGRRRREAGKQAGARAAGFTSAARRVRRMRARWLPGTRSVANGKAERVNVSTLDEGSRARPADVAVSLPSSHRQLRPSARHLVFLLIPSQVA